MDLLNAIRAGGDIDVLRQGMQLVLQELIELEAGRQAIGAARYERAENRLTHRNGSRGQLLSTKAGDDELRIPKLRAGSFLPALLEPRRRIDGAAHRDILAAPEDGRAIPDTMTRLAPATLGGITPMEALLNNLHGNHN